MATLSELLAQGVDEQTAIKRILAESGYTVAKKREVKRTITVNKNGGLFFKDPNFKAWSHKKQKEYVAGINMDMSIARELFNNEELLQEIRDFVNQSDERLEALLAEKLAKKENSLGLY